MNTMISNPYVGPRTFLESERDRFFGRDREARDLLALVVSEPLVLFYAQSGAGKSSLVNTRLIPDLRKRGFSIITGRVGGDAPAGMEVENVFVFNLVRSLAPKEVDSVTLAAISLKDFLCNVLLNKPPDRGQETPFSKKRVLIIDQFEEIFRIHHEAWEKREDFFVQLAEAMEADPYLWVVLVMREDFTASLDSYLHLLPGRLRMRYYMQRLERASALEAIKKPVIEMRPYEEGVAEKLVDDLRSVKVFKPDGTPDMQPGQYVEPVQLQVVCSNLWQNLPPNGRTITIQDIQDVGDVDTSLGNYYADRVKAAAASYHIKEWKIREWFSKKLISPGGIRNMVLMDPTGKTDGLENQVIQSLSDLIRTEQRGGGVFYELTHDRLVKPILANNEKWENQHLNLLQRGAVLWSARDRSEDVLLRGRELIKAENEARNIELTDLEEAYLNASRRMRSQENKERKQKRLLFLLAVGALIAMCAAFSLFLVSMGLLNRSNTQLNQMQSLRLALVSKILLGNDVDSNPEVAALLSIRSLDEMYIPEADSALVDSMDRLYAVHTFVGHQKGIRSIAVSSDGNQLATGSDDSTIKIWNIQNGDLIRTLEGHTSWISDLAFSPDGKTLLSGSYDSTAKIWDLASGKPLFTLKGHTGSVLGVAYSPDGSFVLTGSNDHTAILWNAHSGMEVSKLEGHKDTIWDVAFSPDGKYILTGSDDKTAKIWDTYTGKEVYSFDDYGGEVYSVGFSPDNKRIVIGGRGTVNLEIWDILSHERILGLSQHRDTVRSVAFSHNGYYILSGSYDDTAVLWSSITGEVMRTFSGHSASVESVAFSADDRYVFTGSSDGTAKMWLTSEARLPRKFSGKDKFNRVMFFPDSKSIFTVSEDGYAIVWSTDTGIGLHVYSGVNGYSNAGELSADGKYYLGIANDGTAKLWDTQTGKEIQSYDQVSWTVALSPKLDYVLTGGSDGMVKVWEMRSGKEVKEFDTQGDGVVFAKFSPDSKHIFISNDNSTAKLWDLETSTEVYTLNNSSKIWNAAFSPDGKYILTGNFDHMATLWDASSGTRIRDYKGHTDRVFGVAFSSDGRYIVTGSADHTAKLWETSTGKVIRTLNAHSGEVNSVAFSPDDKYIATASTDGTVHLWDFDYHTTMELACSILTRDLTDEEHERNEVPNDARPTCTDQQGAGIIPVTSRASSAPTPDEIKAILYTGHILDTLVMLDRAQGFDRRFTDQFDAPFWNQLCWFGTLGGYSVEVKDFCERAVRLDSESGDYRDSRGLNRILLGNTSGAIEDFTYAVDWWKKNNEDPKIIQKRQSWITALEQGKNPFDRDLLRALEDE